MKKSLIILAATACLALGTSAIAQTNATAKPAATSTAPTSPQDALMQLKQRLGIQGAAQEAAWSDFAKLSLTPPTADDMLLMQRMQQAKNTPELFGVLDDLQKRGQVKYGQQRDAMVGVYNTLNQEQRVQFDGFVLGTMGSMLGAMRR